MYGRNSYLGEGFCTHGVDAKTCKVCPVEQVHICGECGKEYGTASDLRMHYADLHSVKQLSMIRLRSERDALREALEEIVRVASGEKQVAVDDTEGMAWIDKFSRAAIGGLKESYTNSVLCPSCQATDNNPYIDSHGQHMRACGRCMIQWVETP